MRKRSISLCRIQTVSISSNNVSSPTLPRRNKCVDTLFRALCADSKCSPDDVEPDVLNQLASHIKRNRTKLYTSALELAGISSCELTVEHAAPLKNPMSDNLYRAFITRAFICTKRVEQMRNQQGTDGDEADTFLR